jgi:predicted lipid-binding transport protein (Tim44 family)
MKGKVITVLLILVMGILIGIALTTWFVSVIAAIAEALVIVLIVSVAYLLIRRRARNRRQELRA